MAGLINYVRKVFKNYPDTSTPTTAENLNVMDKGIYDLDQALGTALGTADISTVGDGTIKGAISTLNNDLTAVYDKSTGKWYERNADGTRGSEISTGSQLSCIKHGTVAANTSGETVYLGQTIPTTDYIVLLDVPGSASTPASYDSNGYFRGNYNNSYAYMSAKTTTSFKITSNVLTSYQVVKLK